MLEKIENAVNLLLIRLGELILRSIPGPIKALFAKLSLWLQFIIQNFKQLPSMSKKLLVTLFLKIKASALSFDYKGALVDTYNKAMTQYKEKSPGGMSSLKKIFVTPILMIAQWLNGLSTVQAVVLISFSCASFLAVIGIGFSGHRMVKSQNDPNRIPASIEDEILYDRPEYYKKQTKFFDITNLRLPVYFAKVNEIRSVDIDFSATMSNRNAKRFLEKNEFHVRDHLILQIEPSVASFPLEEEGKEIIRKKILNELNIFLKSNKIEGEVLELKIIYVLAN